jgi:hypothetical protein
MKHVLTGAVKLAGTYVDESGAERQYVLTRGQDVTALGLPHSVVQELIGKVRPMGGRRGKPIPYFTAVEARSKPAVEEDKAITISSLHEAMHEGRIAAGVVEPDAPFDEDGFEKVVPQLPEEPEAPLGSVDAPATTPEEAEVAAASEPVVSPTADEEVATCENPDCQAGGDTETCQDDNCPVNEAPVEPEAVEEAVAEAPQEAKAVVPICAGTTKAGNPCKGKAVAGNDYCMAHQPK